MKILVINNCASGLIQFRTTLIKELIKIGYEIHVVVPITESKIEQEYENDLRKIGCKVSNVYLDRRGQNPIKDFKLFINYFKIVLKTKYNYVITYTIKPNVYGGVACMFSKTEYVTNITGLGTMFEKDGLTKKFIIKLYKFALKKAKVVFFENEENKNVFLNNNIIKEKQAKVLNGAGVNLKYFKYIDYPDDDSVTRFLFIGRVMKEKGIDELLCATKQLVKEGYKCVLDVVGSLEEDYSTKLHECEKEGWLIYHGIQKDVRPYIAKCNCFVLPSWHEGMANTNLECAASGRPIITSNIYGCKEAVIDEKSGYLVEIKDVNNLYTKMKEFINLSNEKKEKMGIIGRRHIEKEFDKIDVVKKTIDYLLI